MELDRISNLPGNIIDQILSHLPFMDAARTSVLSRKWRYKWAELPYLVFDHSSLPFPIQNLASIVDHVLLLHTGPILKFELSRMDRVDGSSLDRWIIYLSRGPIKELELTIFEDNYLVPSCLFSCQSLTRLVLYGCCLIVPSRFKGFPNLKSLNLSYVNLTQDVFENLVSNCPVLERLTVSFSNRISHLTINAPNLQFFYVQANLEGISFENTSRLEDVTLSCETISENQNRTCRNSSNLRKFFVQLPMIRRLDIDSFYLKYLAVGNEPSKLPISFVNLDYLSLTMDLDNQGDCLRALCLLSISPNLIELKIDVISKYDEETVAERETNVWRDDCCNCLFTKLQFIEITGSGASGVQPELNFIKFMLLYSPVLERMVIRPDFGGGQPELLMSLLCLKRDSERARVICLCT